MIGIALGLSYNIGFAGIGDSCTPEEIAGEGICKTSCLSEELDYTPDGSDDCNDSCCVAADECGGHTKPGTSYKTDGEYFSGTCQASCSSDQEELELDDESSEDCLQLCCVDIANIDKKTAEEEEFSKKVQEDAAARNARIDARYEEQLGYKIENLGTADYGASGIIPWDSALCGGVNFKSYSPGWPLGKKIKCGVVRLSDIPEQLIYWITLFLKIIPSIGVMMILVGAAMYLYGAATEDKDKGKEAIKWAVIGLIVSFSSWVFVDWLQGFIS